MSEQHYTGISHGTLGELFQGALLRDEELHVALVSLPLKRYCQATYTPTPGEPVVGLDSRPKTRRILERYLAFHKLDLPPGRWSFNTELLCGKGMSSSTADMVAAVRAMDAFFSLSSSPAFFSDILRGLERSDGVFFEHYALYLSSKQEIVHHFSFNPQLFVCCIDEGYEVDTEGSTHTLLSYYKKELPAYLSLLDKTVQAFTYGDLPQICQCSTESARLSQGVFPKKTFEVLRAYRQRFKADGIVAAHTGSLIGYLFTRPSNYHEMGVMSSFFLDLGYQCRFFVTGF